MAGIVEGPLSREESEIYEREFDCRSEDYLRGYIDSHKEGRGFIRSIFEKYLWHEPKRIRIAKRAISYNIQRKSKQALDKEIERLTEVPNP